MTPVLLAMVMTAATVARIEAANRTACISAASTVAASAMGAAVAVFLLLLLLVLAFQRVGTDGSNDGADDRA